MQSTTLRNNDFKEKRTWRLILVSKKFSNKGPTDDFGPGPRDP